MPLIPRYQRLNLAVGWSHITDYSLEINLLKETLRSLAENIAAKLIYQLFYQSKTTIFFFFSGRRGIIDKPSKFSKNAL